MLSIYRSAAVALALCAAGTAAYAADGQTGEANDALAVNQAKISLSQAVSAAVQHAHGKASKAEYERTSNGDAYDVEVVRGKQVFDVRVDATSGAVIASTPDKADHDDDQDEAD